MKNTKIKEIVSDECAMYMRDDVRVRYTEHKTGITACFRVFLGYRGVTPEYAQICNVRLHRVMKPETIRKHLRFFTNLYPETVNPSFVEMPSPELIAFKNGYIVYVSKPRACGSCLGRRPVHDDSQK